MGCCQNCCSFVVSSVLFPSSPSFAAFSPFSSFYLFLFLRMLRHGRSDSARDLIRLHLTFFDLFTGGPRRDCCSLQAGPPLTTSPTTMAGGSIGSVWDRCAPIPSCKIAQPSCTNLRPFVVHNDVPPVWRRRSSSIKLVPQPNQVSSDAFWRRRINQHISLPLAPLSRIVDLSSPMWPRTGAGAAAVESEIKYRSWGRPRLRGFPA